MHFNYFSFECSQILVKVHISHPFVFISTNQPTMIHQNTIKKSFILKGKTKGHANLFTFLLLYSKEWELSWKSSCKIQWIMHKLFHSFVPTKLSFKESTQFNLTFIPSIPSFSFSPSTNGRRPFKKGCLIVIFALSHMKFSQQTLFLEVLKYASQKNPTCWAGKGRLNG